MSPPPSSSSHVKSRKILNHWREAAGMSKLGNRTKNLLGKWQRSNSQSVDTVTNHPNPHFNHHPMPGGAAACSAPGVGGSNGAIHGGGGSLTLMGSIHGSDPGSFSEGGLGSGGGGQVQSFEKPAVAAAPTATSANGHPTSSKAKTQWSEHVWSEYFYS